MFIVSFVRIKLKTLCSNVRTTCVNKGVAGGRFFANKGCMVLSFDLNGKTLNFIGGHLAAMPSDVSRARSDCFIDRNRMMGSIIRQA